MGEIYKKLLEIRKQVSALEKDVKKGGTQKFDYVSSSNVLRVFRPLMDEAGLLLIPEVLETVFHHKGEGFGHVTELKMKFTWFDTESGESLECPWYGQGVDPQEKGVGKALTYAEKYFILKFNNVPTDKDDPDDSRNVKESSQKSSPATFTKRTEKQAKMILDTAGKHKLSVEEAGKVVDWFKIGPELAKVEASSLIKRMLEDWDNLIDEYMQSQAYQQDKEQDIPD